MANTSVSEKRNYRYYLRSPMGVARYKRYLKNRRDRGSGYRAYKEFYDKAGDDGIGLFMKKHFTRKGWKVSAYEKQLKRDAESVDKLRDAIADYKDSMRGR